MRRKHSHLRSGGRRACLVSDLRFGFGADVSPGVRVCESRGGSGVRGGVRAFDECGRRGRPLSTGNDMYTGCGNTAANSNCQTICSLVTESTSECEPHPRFGVVRGSALSCFVSRHVADEWIDRGNSGICTAELSEDLTKSTSQQPQNFGLHPHSRHPADPSRTTSSTIDNPQQASRRTCV